jgi:hypothetical protein
VESRAEQYGPATEFDQNSATEHTPLHTGLDTEPQAPSTCKDFEFIDPASSFTLQSNPDERANQMHEAQRTG